ncbi:MAG: COX15/CtaA family protein [Verrucomicrobia bacterium]|nr:COX15/CtaA family protein [Verrucomicrobiota bacterium]
MARSTGSLRTPTYKPALAIFAVAGSAWVFVLVTLGAFTTSINAGMVFPDWPLSNGSVNPDGWLRDLSMFAEHSHRLTGMVMGFITIALAVWLSRREERRWLRHLGWWALAIVVVQGLIGGKRVLLHEVSVPGFQMSLGEMLRIPHGIMAQVYVCLLIAIAAACTRHWIESPHPVGSRVRRLGLLSCALLLIQLIIAATMRHNQAGLAIYTFPFSTPPPDNAWLPAVWDFRIGIHFAHRVMAAILAVALTGFAWAIRRDRACPLAMRAGASALLSLLVLQILLGAQIVWTLRKPEMTTAHVVVGALTLAVTFWLTWVAHRDQVEGPAPLATPSRP